MSARHLRDTTIKLSTCTRCGTYVFACEVGGFKTAVNPAPVSLDAYRAALVAGERLYRVQTVAGAPWKLHRAVEWYDGLVAEHACGTRAMNVAKVEVAPVGPQKPSVTSGGLRGGCPPPRAPAGPQTALQRFHATPVSPRRSSEGVWRCDRCRRIIGPHEMRWSVEVGPYRWAVHDDGGCDAQA